jgi:hypothetical protein
LGSPAGKVLSRTLDASFPRPVLFGDSPPFPLPPALPCPPSHFSCHQFHPTSFRPLPPPSGGARQRQRLFGERWRPWWILLWGRRWQQWRWGLHSLWLFWVQPRWWWVLPPLALRRSRGLPPLALQGLRCLFHTKIVFWGMPCCFRSTCCCLTPTAALSCSLMGFQSARFPFTGKPSSTRGSRAWAHWRRLMLCCALCAALPKSTLLVWGQPCVATANAPLGHNVGPLGSVQGMVQGRVQNWV